MSAQLFDNYEEDGQLSFFGADGPELEEERGKAEAKEQDLPPGHPGGQMQLLRAYVDGAGRGGTIPVILHELRRELCSG